MLWSSFSTKTAEKRFFALLRFCPSRTGYWARMRSFMMVRSRRGCLWRQIDTLNFTMKSVLEEKLRISLVPLRRRFSRMYRTFARFTKINWYLRFMLELRDVPRTISFGKLFKNNF